MAWNDVVSNVKEKFRRLGRGNGRQIQLARETPHVEQLGDLATPLVDVYENDKELLIHADVPGGNHAAATVAWDDSRGLTMFVKSPGLPSGALRMSEYKPRDWYRAFELPAYADGSKAAATIKDGVLTVRVPKRLAAPKLIPIKAS